MDAIGSWYSVSAFQRFRATAYPRLGGWAVGFCVSPFSFGVPHVFGGSEGNAVDLAGEMAAAFGLWIVENHFHRVIVVLIPINQHHGPQSVRALDCIRRDQQRSRSIGHVARNFEKFVGSIDRLDPLLGNYLGCQILRRIALQVIVFIEHENAVIVPRMRHVVEKVGSLGTGGHHRSATCAAPYVPLYTPY